MQKPRRQHRAGRSNRMSVRNGTALDVDNILRQPKVLGDRNGDGRKRFVNFDALDI